MTLYRAFATGTKERELIPLESFNEQAYERILKNLNQDYYESLFVYEEKHLARFKQTGSLSGIDDIKVNRLVFDFDSKDLSKAQDDAKKLVKKLQDNKINNKAIRVFFSGHKGYHVEIHLKEFLSKEQFSSIVDGLAGDLETFDFKIKDHQRIFRYPLTKNPKTGLLKIPLYIKELNTLTPEQVKSKAADYSDEFEEILNTYQTIDLPESFKSFTVTKPEVKVESSVEITDKPDMSRKPGHLTSAKYVLQEGFFDEGERNEACMILASTYRYLGYNKELAYNMIKATLRLRAERLGRPEYDKKELWNTIIKVVYSPLWKGGLYSEEEGLLKKTIERYSLEKTIESQATNLVSLSNVSSVYRDFAVNIDKNTIKLGIPEIDQKVRVTTSMLVCLLAAPGAGKTSVSLGILNTMSKNQQKALFFSLDMAIPQVYQRLIQKHTGDHPSTIEKNYVTSNLTKIEEYENVLNNEYEHVKFCFRTGLTTEEMRNVIIKERDKTGVTPKLIVIDYLECVKGPFSDSNANKALIATQLKDIANEFGICVFLLTQPTKMDGDPSYELSSYTQIKGSSVIGEAASVVFTMYRPGFSSSEPQYDKFAVIKVVKNRMGELSTTELGWEGLTGRIFSLDSEQRMELKELQEKIKLSRMDSKKNDGNLW